MDMRFVHQPAAKRFECILENGTAYLTYNKTQDYYELLSVYVPDSLRGQGIAGQLVQAVLEELKSQNIQIKATCSYVVSYLEKHPEYQAMLFDKA